jgi:hypothetical protein
MFPMLLMLFVRGFVTHFAARFRAWLKSGTLDKKRASLLRLALLLSCYVSRLVAQVIQWRLAIRCAADQSRSWVGFARRLSGIEFIHPLAPLLAS